MKKFVYFLSGCLFMSVVMASVVAFAETPASIDVIFGRVKLMVNGEAVDKETMLYDGTTYIPLRAAAETLGMEVTYDDETKTAYIDDKEVVEETAEEEVEGEEGADDVAETPAETPAK